MPNIAGIYLRKQDSTDLRGVLEGMAQVLDVPSVEYATRSFLGRRAGCVNLLRGITATLNQPAHDPATKTCLMLDGELYNLPELRLCLHRLGQDASRLDDPQLCLALYLAEGERFVARLNGQFNIVIYRESDESLLIANDRYAYRPLFIAEDGARLLFGVEMKAILAALEKPPDVDGIGLLQIMHEGITIGSRTWLDPIRVLDPGTLLHATPDGKVRCDRYHRVRYRDGGAGMSASAFVEGFGIKLHQAVERVMKRPGRIGISLSGGLDSRSVALAISPAHLPIPAYTFGYEDSRDVMYAKRLADLLHLQHLHLAFDSEYLGAVLPAVVWRNEALFPYAAATSIYFHEQIAGRMDIILNGHCGDALTGSHLRPFMLWTRSRESLISHMYARRQLVPEENVRRLFNPSFYDRHHAQLRDAMRATFAEIDNDDPANVADVWDMENRQRRGTFHSPSVDRYRFEQRTPFLDNDLVDHLVGAPPRWRFQQQAYKRMILYTFPQARHIPWAYTASPLNASLAVELARTGWNWGRNRLSGLMAKLGHNGHLLGQQFRDLGAEMRHDRRVGQAILEFADSSSFPSDVFEAQSVKDLVERHCDRGEDHTHLMSCMATFAMAYRLFLFERPKAIPPEADWGSADRREPSVAEGAQFA